MRRLLLGTCVLAFIASSVQAEVKTKTIPYKHGDLELEGHLAWDDAVSGPRPAVLVVHEWWGLNDYAEAGRATREDGLRRLRPRHVRQGKAGQAPG